MLGSSVVAVKGMHNHPPRALCLPARRASARKLDAPGAPLPMLPVAPNLMDALALQSDLKWLHKLCTARYLNVLSFKDWGNKLLNIEDIQKEHSYDLAMCKSHAM